MSSIRFLLLVAFVTIASFSAAVYSSCKKDKCNNVQCQNNGVCNSGTCVCAQGFEGLRCETLMRDKFLFNYNGYDLCNIDDTNRFKQYSIHFLAVLHDSTEMVIKNFADSLQDSVICTVQSTDSFTFLGSNNSTTWTGYGHLSNDSLWLVYHVAHDTVEYDCKYFGQSLR